MLFHSIFVASLPLIGAITPPRQPYPPRGNGTKRLDFNSTVINKSFEPETRDFRWVNTGVDGDYIYLSDSGALVFENVGTGQSKTFVAADKIPKGFESYTLSPNLTHVLWKVNYTQKDRYSYIADFLVLDVKTGQSTPLDPTLKTDIQYATWNPKSASQIAFVKGNNLYIWTNGVIRQITTNGGPDLFNAVPDWIYEEEMLNSESALWYSPDGEKIAFLLFNDTGVGTYRISSYIDYKDKKLLSYPNERFERYPKVGTKNPTVALNILDIKSEGVKNIPITAFPGEEVIIGDVAWLTDGHDKVAYRAFNRVQDKEKVVVVNTQDQSTKVVHERSVSEGWLYSYNYISYLGPLTQANATNSSATKNYYFDISDESGWLHMYLYPVDGGDKIALTSGEWEFYGLLSIDVKRGLIYYISTEHHSTDSHVYSVNFRTLEKKALVDDKVTAFWAGSWSTGHSYYVLDYRGPDVPYQELYSINSTKPIRTIVDNKKLYDTLQGYALPNTSFIEMTHPSGYKLDAKLTLPPNFDPKKKYPLLLAPYGAPDSKNVRTDWVSLDWILYLSSDPELEYIVLNVDNRGTGRKGRKFRDLVSKNLGQIEAEDQVWAAKEYAKNPWVDSSHVAIWGFSYGGFLAAKAIELGDPIFSFAIVTEGIFDWRFYDTFYTERYMKLPADNAAGYNRSRIHDVTGFKKVAGGVLIQHGTADDNVHFQNAVVFTDFLISNGVTPDKFYSTYLPEGGHGPAPEGQDTFYYRQLSKSFWEAKLRVADSKGAHQWSKRNENANVKKRSVATIQAGTTSNLRIKDVVRIPVMNVAS